MFFVKGNNFLFFPFVFVFFCIFLYYRGSFFSFVSFGDMGGP